MTVDELIQQAQRTKDPQLLTSLVPGFRACRYRKGEALFRQGELWTHAFFVERGLLRVHITGRDGSDFNKSFWHEGTLVLPLTREMETQPSLFGLSALEDTVAWQIGMGALREGLVQRGLWEPMRAALLTHLLNLKLQREHDLLTLDGSARYARFREQHPQLAARVPLVHLASFLGLTAVSLSRIRRRLRLTAG